jgi:hypothetical protein
LIITLEMHRRSCAPLCRGAQVGRITKHLR